DTSNDSGDAREVKEAGEKNRGYAAAVAPIYPGRAVRAGVATAQGEWIDLQALPKPAEAARDDAQGALF
ncbi:hypothetical protein, partial [Ralstonia pseudosolanacearum]|uniref:hypothetical protein n=1 Tax=Ralstonia pseudosolanacearum TaxID=1310165 RepID=UPI00322186FF